MWQLPSVHRRAHTHLLQELGLSLWFRGRHRTATQKLWRGRTWLSEHNPALTQGRFTRAPPMALPKFTVKKILRFPSCALLTSVPAPASSCSCVVIFWPQRCSHWAGRQTGTARVEIPGADLRDASRPRAQSPWLYSRWNGLSVLLVGLALAAKPEARLQGEEKRQTIAAKFRTQVGNECACTAYRISLALLETLDRPAMKTRSSLLGAEKGFECLLGASLKGCPNRSPNHRGTWLTF